LLEPYGYEIIAIDYSPDMLGRAKEKAQKKNSRVDFRQQDMRTLDVPERPFDAIICCSIRWLCGHKREYSPSA